MTNITRAMIVLLVFTCLIVPLMAQFQQQRGKVLQANPKYMKSVSIFTTRHSRNSPYSTDCNVTLLAAWGNNVTLKTMYYKHKAKSDAMAIELKTCDMVKLKWVKDWVVTYSNLSVDTCPLLPGVYRFTGFEIPPKNFPIHLALDRNSDYETSLTAYVTKTKEVILEISMDLKFETKPKVKRKNIKKTIHT